MKGERIKDKRQMPYPAYVDYENRIYDIIEWCEDNIACKWQYWHQNTNVCYIYITEEEYRMAFKLRWSF